MLPKTRATAHQHGQAVAATLCFSSSYWAAWWRKRLAVVAVPAYEWILYTFNKRDAVGSHALRSIHSFQFVHILRWPYLGGPQRREYLDRTYHLFIGNYNGGFDKYIDDFADGVALQLKVFLHGCAGYKAPHPVSKFREFMTTRVIETEDRSGQHRQHYYSAYPEASARDITLAFDAARQFDRLRRNLRRHGDATFPARFRESMDDVSAKLSISGAPTRLAKGSLRTFQRDQIRQITLLCPFDLDASDQMMDEITSIDEREDSPFASLPEVHFARLLMIDNSTFPHPARVPKESIGLRNGYLLLNVVFDGNKREFLKNLFAVLKDGLAGPLGLCFRFPDLTLDGFYWYASKCEVGASWHYQDSRGKSVADVKTALAKQSTLVELLADRARLQDPSAFASDFSRRAEAIQGAVRPG